MVEAKCLFQMNLDDALTNHLLDVATRSTVSSSNASKARRDAWFLISIT